MLAICLQSLPLLHVFIDFSVIWAPVIICFNNMIGMIQKEQHYSW